MGIGFAGPRGREISWTPDLEGSAESSTDKYRVAIATIDNFLQNGQVTAEGFDVEDARASLSEPAFEEGSDGFRRWVEAEQRTREDARRWSDESKRNEAVPFTPPTYAEYLDLVRRSDEYTKILVDEVDSLNRLKEEIARGETENAIKYFLDFAKERQAWHATCLEAIRSLMGYKK